MTFYIIGGLISAFIFAITAMVLIQLEGSGNYDDDLSLLGAALIAAVIWPITVTLSIMYGISVVITKIIKTIG